MQALFADRGPCLLELTDVEAGAFRFSKGTVQDFHYKNLSGGEKAAFDVLLDVFVNRNAAPVLCIDEPELHIAPGIQGRLINEILNLLPRQSQLWIATHSIGIIKEADRLRRERPKEDEVVFLDFSDRDFDGPVTIKPAKTNRAFWNNMYRETLADLGSLVAPNHIVLCEGDPEKNVRGFDAQCYNEIFAETFPETLFCSVGGSNDVLRAENLVNVLKSVADGVEVTRLRDRDDMTDGSRESHLKEGIRVLSRRELEDYIWDQEVLRTFLETEKCNQEVADELLTEISRIREDQQGPVNVKDAQQKTLAEIRKRTKLRNLGNSREEFALEHLVPALRSTPAVFRALQADVFG